MAQILKFAGGGSTPSSSWGTFTIDNVTYKMDDDNIQRLYDHAKTLDPDVAHQFDFIINTLKSGKNLSYSNNKLYGEVDFETSDRQAKKIKEKPARGFGKGRDARLAISSLDNLSLSNPNPETKNIKLNKRFAEYERDNEGNFILGDNNSKKWIKGANNQEILDLLDQIETYSLSPEEFTISGIEGKDAKWLRSFYNSYGKEGWANLKNSISNGTWNQATVEALNDINLFLDRQPTDAELAEKSKREVAEEEARIAKEESARYGSSGFNKDQSHLIAYDKTSNSFKIVDPNVAQFISSLGNVWLNDEFAQAYPTYAPLLEGHDNGLFVVNGKLYDAEDDALLEIPLVKQWIDENKRKVGGSDLIKWDWKTNPEDNWITDTWNNVPIHNTYGLTNYRDLTGLYDNLGTYNSSPISNIFQVYPDQITPEMYDEFGFFKPEHYKYVVYSNGNAITDLEPESFNEYLKSLKLAGDSKKEKYYSSLPNYLYPTIVNKSGNRLIEYPDRVLYNEKTNKYYYRITLNDGTTFYNVLSPEYKYGSDPLDFITKDKNDNYSIVDLSSYGLTDTNGIAIKKKGGKILKAEKGNYVPGAVGNLNWKQYKQQEKKNEDYNRKSAKKAFLKAQPQHGSNNKDYNWNFQGSDIVELGRLIGSLWSTEKANEELQKTYNDIAIKLAPKYPVIKRPIYNDPTLKNQLQINEFRKTPLLLTSNADSNALQSLLKEEKIRNWEMANNAQRSESYNTFMNQNREIDNQESAMFTEGENQYRKQLASLEQQRTMAKNATLTQNMESISNYLHKISAEMDQDRIRRTNIEAMEKKNEYDKKFFEAVKKAYDVLPTNEKMSDDDRSDYHSIFDFMSSMHPEKVSEIKSNLGLDYQIDLYNKDKSWFSRKYKKGGKTKNLSDKLLLQQNVATAKEIHSLNRDIIKLFLNMMK